jgi:3-oxoacyl-[acyl-carrier protein] reductase
VGPVSILVNNAGISPKLPGGKSAGLLEISSAEWDRVLDVNLSAAMRLCQLFVPRMKASSSGRIVNVTSLAGRARSAFADASYSASKAGLIPVRRLGTPAEVASAIVYPASEDAAFINGAPLDLNGGVYMT